MNTSDNISRMRRGLIAIAIIFPGLYLLFAIVSVLQNYRTTMDRAESDVRNISATLNEHAMRSIGEADTRLQGAIADIERRGLSIPGPEDIEIHGILKWHARQLPQAITLYAIDAKGIIRAAGTSYPMQPLDISARSYYQHHVSHADPDLLISNPVKSRANGKWAITLTRRISQPDGSLKMIVGLAIDLDYFNSFYRTLRMGEQSRLLLVRQDGWVLMETPLTEQVMDMNMANTRLFEQLRQAPAGAFRTDRGALDGMARIVGYASSTQYPLIATASMTQDYVLTPWRRQTWQIALIGIVSIAMLYAMIALLWRRLNELVTIQEGLTGKNQDLLKSERRYHELVDGIDGIVWEADLPDFRFTYVSGNAGALSGYSAQEWMADPRFWQEKLSTSPDGQGMDAFLAINSHTTVLQPVEHHLFTPAGKEIWLRSNIRLAGAAGEALRLRGVTVDITGQRISEKRLYQMTHFDPLTKLPNRQTLTDRIEHALVIAARNNAWLAVMLIDMDQFKTINDGLGHEMGDQVLCSVAQRIQACLGPTDTLARIGGDEFVVLLERIDDDLVGIEQLAEHIAKSVGEPIALDGKELYIGISMGISLYPQDGADCETLMRNADTALYRAKAAGRNCWRFFDESMARHVAKRLEIESALRRAIEREELLLYFQPQHALESGRVVGVEALVRWSRPGTGIVPPLEFIPVAEESGLILPIGTWVLETACKQAVAWIAEHNLPLRMAVNVAAKQIHHKDFVEQVRRVLDETGLPPDLLELEITESSIVENIEETVSKLHQIKALGVTVAVDDFGTGYSSLSYLKELPIDRLKIDRSFITDIPVNANDCAIARTIIAMARNLGLAVIAEGVESQEQVDFLRAEKCDEIQGYLLSPPIPADKLISRYTEPAPLQA